MSIITPTSPIAPPMESTGDRMITLELKDGTTLQGYSFGAETTACLLYTSRCV